MIFSFLSEFITRVKEKFKPTKYPQELINAENLYQKGELDKAIKELHKLTLRENLEALHQIRFQILNSTILIEKGENEKGLKLAEKAYEKSREINNQNLMIEADISKANALIGLGKLNTCLEIIEEDEKLLSATTLKNKLNEMNRAALKRIKGKAIRRKGEMDQALEYLKESLSIYEKLDLKFEIAGVFNEIGIIHASKGELDLALEYLQQSLEEYEGIGNIQPTFKLFNNIGLIYSYKGEPDKALENYEKSLELSEKFGTRQSAAALLLNIGLIYMNKGELNQALDYNQQSLEKYEELESKGEIATCLGNLGNIYEEKGDLEKALEAYTRSLAISEKLENKSEIATCYNNIGNVYVTQGNVEKAVSFYQRSYEIFESMGNNVESSTSLQNLISVEVNYGDREKANQYLKKLQAIAEKDDNKTIDLIYRLSQAFVLKTSDRMVKRAEAQEIFQKITDEEIIQHQYTFDAMLNLCYMLLQELRSSGSEEVLSEIKNLLNRLLDIAEKQHSYKYLVNSQMLQSKVALLELDLDSARQILAEAQQVASEKGLENMVITISAEYDLLEDQLTKWTELIESNVSMVERLEFAELESMVSRIIRKKEEIPKFAEEEPAMFLILSKKGKVQFSNEFVSKEVLDDQVIGDLLTAINNFIQETFSATGIIERIKHREYTLVIKPVLETLLCCFVFKGHSYFAIQKLEKFIESAKESKPVWGVLESSSKSDEPVSDPSKLTELSSQIFLSSLT